MIHSGDISFLGLFFYVTATALTFADCSAMQFTHNILWGVIILEMVKKTALLLTAGTGSRL